MTSDIGQTDVGSLKMGPDHFDIGGLRLVDVSENHRGNFKNVIELWHFETNGIIIYMIYCNKNYLIKSDLIKYGSTQISLFGSKTSSSAR